MTIQGLTRRIDAAIAGIERQRIEQDATRIAGDWIREGLMRKLALLPDQGIPGDLVEQFRQIDRDQARRQSSAIRAALALYRQRCPATGAKERLLAKLGTMSEREQEDFIARCKKHAGDIGYA